MSSGDPYRYFRTEARELIEALMQGVLDLEKAGGDVQIVSRLLRYAHTLKGAARVVKQTRMADLSHSIEDGLAGVRDSGAGISADRVRQLLGWIDGMSADLAALDPARPAAPAPRSSAVPAEIAVAPAAAPETTDERFESIRVDVSEMDALLRGVSELRVQISGLSRHVRELEGTARLASELDGPSAARARTRVGDDVGTVEQLGKALRDVHRAVSDIVDRFGREIDDLHDQAAALRLVPVTSLFPLLERAVRDAADATGKRVSFAASGGDVRLDAQGLRVLRHALAHIVRNAVTHGVELPTERVAAGKPLAGRVQLDVRRRGDRAVFLCSDDGRGIDVDRVRQVLLARGLATPAQAAELTPEGATALLLGGGISTTRSVSQLSGRGIGLDVVREVVASLDGSVSASTDAGRGTRVEVSVPVMVESQEVLHLRSGGSIVSIPRQGITHTLRVTAADIAESPEGHTIVCGGTAVRFAPLGRLMKSDAGPLAASMSAVVLESGSRTAALGVDRLAGTERVVIRSLPEILGPIAMISGAFLDQDGNPQLVLSVDGVVQAIRSGVSTAVPAPPRRRPPLLVIDDSLTTRMLEQAILENAGYEVDTASSGEEALDKARRRRYGLFIVDVEMPGMDGFTFVRTAQAMPELSAVPSIVLTSRDSAEDRARGAAAGARAYFVKSAFDEELLLRTIRGLVG
jgi:two-component system chemotaxis sensor kinase CheA